MKRFRRSRLIKLKNLLFSFLIMVQWILDFKTNISWAWIKWMSIKFIFSIIGFFQKTVYHVYWMYLQTAQNICPEYQTPAYIKINFYLFGLSYFIFHILSYFCQRMVTLPVTQKKKGKKNYFPKRRNCRQKEFFSIYFCDSVPQICRFVRRLYAICINNCYSFL